MSSFGVNETSRCRLLRAFVDEEKFEYAVADATAGAVTTPATSNIVERVTSITLFPMDVITTMAAGYKRKEKMIMLFEAILNKQYVYVEKKLTQANCNEVVSYQGIESPLFGAALMSQDEKMVALFMQFKIEWTKSMVFGGTEISILDRITSTLTPSLLKVMIEKGFDCNQSVTTSQIRYTNIFWHVFACMDKKELLEVCLPHANLNIKTQDGFTVVDLLEPHKHKVLQRKIVALAEHSQKEINSFVEKKEVYGFWALYLLDHAKIFATKQKFDSDEFMQFVNQCTRYDKKVKKVVNICNSDDQVNLGIILGAISSFYSQQIIYNEMLSGTSENTKQILQMVTQKQKDG